MTDIRKILQCDPRANYLRHKAEIDKSIACVLESGRYILGSEVCSFEKEFSGFIGTRYGIGVGNGTDALVLALMACGVEAGDEVITVSHTAVATVSAIKRAMAVPVLVDIVPGTYTIDPVKIEKVVSTRTKAIIPVHLYGHPADMDGVSMVAEKHGLKVIEDCAQSAGSTYKSRKTGSIGHAAAFSFYPTKNLGALGDGGMILTDDPTIDKKVRSLREYGWKDRFISEQEGFNSRLDEVQAAILRIKLKYLVEENRLRQNIAKLYDQGLSSENISIPVNEDNIGHVYHQYVINAKNRDVLSVFLKEKGVATSIHYPVPVHLQPAYKDVVMTGDSLENTESVCRQILSLPMYPELSDKDVNEVIIKVNEGAEI